MELSINPRRHFGGTLYVNKGVATAYVYVKVHITSLVSGSTCPVLSDYISLYRTPVVWILKPEIPATLVG